MSAHTDKTKLNLTHFQAQLPKIPQLKKMALAFVVLAATATANLAQATGTLVYCSDASPVFFDGAQSNSGTDFNAGSRAMFDTLLAYKPGTTELIPSLAKTWDISADGKTYIFHLREGVKFHTTDYFKPTRTLQAEDVVFSFGRMVNPQHPANKVYPVEYPYVVSTGLRANIASIKKIDALTVEFKLKEVDAPFLSKVAMAFAAIQSVEYAQQLANAGRLSDINHKPIGTGPFVFGSYVKDEVIRYNGNVEYWNPAAVKLDKLVFAITKDAAVRSQKLTKGECDLIANANPADIAAMKAHPALKIETGTSLNVAYVAYNTEKAELKNPLVRQALDLVIDRQAIVAAAYQGYAKSAASFYPPILWSHNRSLKNAAADLTKARALLAKAGYPNGFETDLWALTSNPIRKITAELIQADWAKIGVKANIVTFEWGEFLKRIKQGEHKTTLMGWTADYADPDGFASPLLTCKAINGVNFARYCAPEFEVLVNKAVNVTNVAERTQLYEQAQTVFKADLPWSPIAYASINQPMRKTVQGFKVGAFGEYDFRYVSN